MAKSGTRVAERSVYVPTAEGVEGSGQWYHKDDEVPEPVAALITNEKVFTAEDADQNDYSALSKRELEAVFESRGYEVPKGSKEELIATLEEIDRTDGAQ